jgi:hypothetical protein
MSMVGFPLLLIPVAIYNIIAFLMPGVHFDDTLVKLTLMSGTEWQVDLSDILLALGILLLLFEVIKGARPGAKYLTDHLLSLIVFGCAAAEFLLWPRFGTSTYFLLSLLALVDFLSGIALRARRGTVLASTATVSKKSARKADASVAEPVVLPVPSPSPMPEPTLPVPAATSVAESVLLDHSEPSLAQPTVLAQPTLASSVVSPKVPSSPEVLSPGLQPGHSLPPPSDPPPR